MVDIFDEIKQDVQKEKFLKFWTRYKKVIINSFTAILIVGAAVGVYKTVDQNNQEKDSINFLHALHMSAEGKTAEAEASLDKVATKGTKGYALLAKLRQASLKAAQDKAASLKLYQEIADDKGTEPLFRDYAKIMQIGQQIDTGDAATLEKQASDLATASNPFRFMAFEYAALLAFKQNKKDDAKKYVQQIIDDVDAPHGLRKRAGELITVFEKK